MNRVETTTTCRRCGAQEVRDGNHHDWPSGWDTLIIKGWSGVLCPPCQEVVLEALKPPVKDAELLNERLGETATRKYYQASGTTIDA